MDKRALSERDICTKYITPALVARGWDAQLQVRENVHLTKGRVIVRGKLVRRGNGKFTDSVLYYKPNVPLAIIEAKDNNLRVGEPPVPLPPLQEQKRIDAMIEPLMKLCDDLEERLAHGKEQASRLVEAGVRDLVA